MPDAYCECGHPRIRHMSDGYGWVCQICMFLNMQDSSTYNNVCTRPQLFKLSQREREQAARAAKDSYPPHTVCVMCGYEWLQHMGYLCPSGDDTFLPLLDSEYWI